MAADWLRARASIERQQDLIGQSTLAEEIEMEALAKRMCFNIQLQAKLKYS